MIEIRISGGQKEMSKIKKMLDRAHVNASKIKPLDTIKSRFAVYLKLKDNVAINALRALVAEMEYLDKR